jgi:hypothetical protein
MLGHPATAGLTMFLPLAGCIVLVFSGYQLNMVLRGFTAYESMRWSDLEHAINTKQLTEWDQSLKEYNQTVMVYQKSKVDSEPVKIKQKKDTSDKKPRQRKIEPENDIKVPLTSIKQVRNIYQSSFWHHLKIALFPPPLNE